MSGLFLVWYASFFYSVLLYLGSTESFRGSIIDTTLKMWEEAPMLGVITILMAIYFIAIAIKWEKKGFI